MRGSGIGFIKGGEIAEVALVRVGLEKVSRRLPLLLFFMTLQKQRSCIPGLPCSRPRTQRNATCRVGLGSGVVPARPIAVNRLL